MHQVLNKWVTKHCVITGNINPPCMCVQSAVCELTCMTSCSPMSEASSPRGPDWQWAGRLWWTSCGPPYPTDLQHTQTHTEGKRGDTDPDIPLTHQSHFSLSITWWQCYTLLSWIHTVKLNPVCVCVCHVRNKLINTFKSVINHIYTHIQGSSHLMIFWQLFKSVSVLCDLCLTFQIPT